MKLSDGLACFNAVTDAGCKHEVHIVGSGPDSAEHSAFHWVNTMLGNVKMPCGAPIMPFETSIFPAISPSFTIDLTAAMTYRALFRNFSMWLFVRLQCPSGF
jgi:hypothetical protein